VDSITHTRWGAAVIRLDVPEREDHVPGQHYVVRLTADDGYQAQRSYSLTSPPSDPLIEMFVERLPDGEVSGFLARELRIGDTLEVRGPIGGWFVWDGSRPALCVGGGSGVAPLVAMLRHALDLGRADLLRVAVAARSLSRLPYGHELLEAGAFPAFSRQRFGDRRPGRVNEQDLKPLLDVSQVAYVCGSAAFAESASQLLVTLGMATSDIHVERFGPTG
jgi:ferredoxin-NADP reductase